MPRQDKSFKQQKYFRSAQIILSTRERSNVQDFAINSTFSLTTVSTLWKGSGKVRLEVSYVAAQANLAS